MPMKFSVEGTASQSGTTGSQNVPSGSVLTLIGSVSVRSIGKLAINLFTVNTGLSDLQVWFAESAPTTQTGAGVSGTAVKRLSSAAGDFAIITDEVNESSAAPHTAGPLGTYVDLDLQGKRVRADFYASSAGGDQVTMDITGVIHVG